MAERLRGLRRWTLCLAALGATVGLALAGKMSSADVANALVWVCAAFAGSDAVDKGAGHLANGGGK